MELSLCRLGSVGCGSDSWWGFDDVGEEGFRKAGDYGRTILRISSVVGFG